MSPLGLKLQQEFQSPQEQIKKVGGGKHDAEDAEDEEHSEEAPKEKKKRGRPRKSETFLCFGLDLYTLLPQFSPAFKGI